MMHGVTLAGLRHVYAAASNEDSREAGFVHGYVSRAMWDALERETGTRFTGDFCRGERSMEPLLRYARAGGRVYA